MSVDQESPGNQKIPNDNTNKTNVTSEDDYDFGGHVEGHEPLDIAQKQIRVLEILPRGAGEPVRRLEDQDLVRCRLLTVSLEGENLMFNASSYVWGRKKDVNVIMVDNELVFVGSNLKSTLRHLRDYHMDAMCCHPLWVDAVCINQQNEDEKLGQVQMMGDIYRRAHRVFSWLGEGDPDTDWLVPMIRSENKT